MTTPKPKPPREVWVNVYSDSDMYLHATRERARAGRVSLGTICAHRVTTHRYILAPAKRKAKKRTKTSKRGTR